MLLLLVAASALMFGGCNAAHIGKKAQPDDTSITNAVEAGLFQDSTLKTRDVRVVSQNGVVTLTGSVNSGVEKLAVEGIANQASGVRQVVDQLTVTPAAVVQSTPEPRPAAPRETTTAPAHRQHVRRVQYSEHTAEARPMSRAPTTRLPAPVVSVPARTADVPRVTPTSPPPRPLIVPAGTVVRVQMIDSIDSKHDQPGQEFAASLAAAVVAGPKVVFPQGADGHVRLVEAQQSGHFRGSSQLELELVSLNYNGRTYNVQSGYYNVHAASRGTRTAQTVGGGAGLGALIGAIAGRGKGAAIGAGIGAATGGGIQALGRGPQIKIPSETKIDFTLKTPITVTTKP